LPRKEDYGFTSQIKRSVLSISAKIAEAYERSHTADKVNFYNFARGSITETQSHLEYGKIAGYFDNKAEEKLDKRLSDLYKNLNIYPLEGQTNDFLNLCLHLHLYLYYWIFCKGDKNNLKFKLMSGKRGKFKEISVSKNFLSEFAKSR